LNFSDYEADLPEVLARMDEAQVSAIVVGTTAETSKKAVELATKHDNIWAIVGLHPIHAGGYDGKPEIFDYDFYKSLAKNDKVVGIGECGFDFFHCDFDTATVQEKAFLGQIGLANELKKPLMLHLRNHSSFDPNSSHDAYARALDILGKESKVVGDTHFFAGTKDHAKRFLDLGFYISFTGVITFVPAYDELVRFVPNDRILSETDAPYVAPAPNRGKRNEPTWVVEVAHKMAELKGYEKGVGEFDGFLEGLVHNAGRLFSIKLS
jgi:TatD DNase family protein